MPLNFAVFCRVDPEETSGDTEGDVEVPVPLQGKEKHKKQLMLKRRRQLQNTIKEEEDSIQLV